MTTSVMVIVLNWNNAPDTIACLASLANLDFPDYTVRVIDNGSEDDSVDVIRQCYPHVGILETHANLGYAGGNNVGVRYALAQGVRYVCILNNDVTVAPSFLTPLIDALEAYPDAGVATPLVAQMDAPEKVWALGQTVDWTTGEITRNKAGSRVSAIGTGPSQEVDIAAGTAMLIRRDVFERAGLMDEAFYLYYEEADWCLRVRSTGFGILAVPSSVVCHKVSAALGPTSPVIDYYMQRNHLRFITRNWLGIARLRLLGSVVLRSLLTLAAYTANSHGGQRLRHRNARLLALRDAFAGRYGQMGPDVASACSVSR
jgi:GT2 family glycosyltransferase